MKYMLLLYTAPENAPEAGAHMDRWFAVTEEMGEAGVLRGGDALQGPDTATTLRDGSMTDGPFAETKEILGGYYVLEVDNLDEAAKWAGKLPIAEYGSIEIRPLQEFDR